MNIHDFIEEVIELSQDAGIMQELGKGLRIQITIRKSKMKFIVLMPIMVQKDNGETERLGQ